MDGGRLDKSQARFSELAEPSRIEKIEQWICYDDCQIKIRQLIGRSIGAGLRSDNNRGPYVSLIQGQVVNRSMRSCMALGAIVLTA